MTARFDNSFPRPTRRLRIDEFAPSRPIAARREAHARSGRRIVVTAVLVLLVVWGALALAFRGWRTRYRERAAFGATQVATAIDPLASVVPDGVDPQAWRQAVADTHAMLVTVTASNLLDRTQMRALRAEIAARASRGLNQPKTARAELAGLWNDLADRAAPLLREDRHPRPKLLPPRPLKDPRLSRARRG